ncbi:methyltransferase domain-containing protein [Caulobacter sp. ErkDOM-E]|uniref:methyltransferase domain-containing protein n=1 Tax=Caulobacter sp. ErkDOM-E TaxID=3402778 RepID=UPI003AF5AEC2
MTHECAKSIARRMHDPKFASHYFVGQGLDVGGAPDPLSSFKPFFPLMSGCDTWDLPQGDGQYLESVADETYDFVHSSHCLEHLLDPAVSLQNWLRVLKPGGHMVVMVPDEDMYEQGVFPSTFNDDHKWTFTIFKPESWSGRSLNVLDLLRQLGPQAEVQKLESLNSTFYYDHQRFDQTRLPTTECAIEFVVRKRPASEVAARGRFPA